MKRIKLRDTAAVYHCMSRVVAGEFLLRAVEKSQWQRMLWKVAEFSGVEVVAHCAMSNHFHVLVRVPVAEQVGDAELLRRYGMLYAKDPPPNHPDAEGLAKILAGEDVALAQRWRERLWARMHDVSWFMKTLKQRYSVWYNKTHERFGTFWAERFKSVLVEDSPRVMRTVAAYIDLNPVRAGLVEDPMDYRWCSYAEAMGGNAWARRGLCRVMASADWEACSPDYRVLLFGHGGQARPGKVGVIPAEVVERVKARGGKVECWELLRCRVRFLTEGAIVGTGEFVRSVGQQVFPERSKTHGLGRIPVTGRDALWSWRNLRRRRVEASRGEAGAENAREVDESSSG